MYFTQDIINPSIKSSLSPFAPVLKAMSFKRRKLPWAPADPVAAGRGGVVASYGGHRYWVP